MPQTKKTKEIDPDNPTWTSETTRRSVSFSELPERLQRTLSSNHGKRGPQQSPTKEPVSIRLSPDVLEALRATGPGWQGRADEALRQQFVTSVK